MMAGTSSGGRGATGRRAAWDYGRRVARHRLIADITPLRQSRQFRILWFGELVSLLGTQLTVVAVPYQTYQITHSTLDVGLVSVGQLIPLLAGSLIGGSIADAHDRRKVLLVAQVLLALTSVGLALNASSSHPALWPIFVLTAIGAGFSGLDGADANAALANVIDRELYASAAALWQLLFQTAGVAGPALAGLVIAGVGIRGAYWIDVATFAVAFVAVAMLQPLPPVGGGRKAGLRSIAEGFAFLKGRQALQGSFVIDLNAMIFGLPRAVFPELTAVRFHGGAVVLGLLYAAPGAGALVASVLTGWVSTIRRQGLAISSRSRCGASPSCSSGSPTSSSWRSSSSRSPARQT